jgi:uncharacterized DUF497 family protein
MEKEFIHLVGFRWDQGNIDKNLIKHGVENWECEQVFFNRPLLVLDDPKHPISEKRWAAFGKTDADRLLIVIFTRRDNLISVISAREMNKNERKFYDEKR